MDLLENELSSTRPLEFDRVNTGMAALYSAHCAGDFDGDGIGDAIVQRTILRPISQEYRLLSGGEPPTYGSSAYRDLGRDYLLGCGDFNGDGYADMFLNGYVSSNTSIPSVYLGSSSGVSSSPAWTLPEQGNARLLIVDHNGDGRMDAWVTSATGPVELYLGNSTGLDSSPSMSVMPDSSHDTATIFGLHVGDLDDDGTDELLVTGTFQDYSVTGSTTVLTERTGYRGWVMELDGSGPAGGTPWLETTIKHQCTWAWKTIGGMSGYECWEDWQEIDDHIVSAVMEGSLTGGGDGLLVRHFQECSGSSSCTSINAYELCDLSGCVSLGVPEEETGPGVSLDLDGDGLDEHIILGTDGTNTVWDPVGDLSTRRVIEEPVAHDRFGSVVDIDGDGREEWVGGLNGETSDLLIFGLGEPPDEDDDGFDAEVDCNDNDDTIYPGAPETWYDGVDSDCAGDSDYDQDKDGIDAPSGGGDDCDDTNAEAYPGADEVVGDGVDQDCDGQEICLVDADSDGFRPEGGETVVSTDADCLDSGEAGSDAPEGDCDDQDAEINPDAPELVGDGVDQDCDGEEICFTDGDGDGYRTAVEVTSEDLDCDDAGEAGALVASPDCDDSDPATYPGATDLAGDGIDQDCDGSDAEVEEEKRGCACSSMSGGSPWMVGGLLGLGVLALRRRRMIGEPEPASE